MEVTATLDVVNFLGDLDPTNDPDNGFVNTWLYDPVTNAKIYSKDNPPPGFIYAHTYNVTVAILEVNETSITDENTKPYLLPKPETTHKVIAGKEWSYQLGRVNDFEGNKVTATAFMRNAASFIDFDADSMTLSIEADKTDKQTQPIFDIRIILTDDHPRDPLSRSYDFTIIIVKDWTDPIETLLEDA